MSDYELDVAIWRCGANGDFTTNGSPAHRLGEGVTKMLNNEGYSCCLGQFARQKGVSADTLLNKAAPCAVGIDYDPVFCNVSEFATNTPLASDLMGINDNYDISVNEKIKLIREELERFGHTLTVINEHLLEEL